MFDSPEVRADELCEMVILTNKRGLHARAAARFVKEVEKFDAEVHVANDTMRVSGHSIMGLMMLAAARGTSLKLCVAGEEAADALMALSDLVRRGFDEEER
jgi:phosphocarrier protein